MTTPDLYNDDAPTVVVHVGASGTKSTMAFDALRASMPLEAVCLPATEMPPEAVVARIHQLEAAAALRAFCPGVPLPRTGSRDDAPRKMRKCALPECRGLTNHRGGYCSPEHCREHRRQTKERTTHAQ